jgi:hypothetical protein
LLNCCFVQMQTMLMSNPAAYANKPPCIWTSAIRYVSGSEMSIPSKDKARARLPKRVPGKGQKFTLTVVQYSVCQEHRGEIAIESSTSVFILVFVRHRSGCACVAVLSRHKKITHPGSKPSAATGHAHETQYTTNH